MKKLGYGAMFLGVLLIGAVVFFALRVLKRPATVNKADQLTSPGKTAIAPPPADHTVSDWVAGISAVGKLGGDIYGTGALDGILGTG